MRGPTAPRGKPDRRHKEPLPCFSAGLFEPFGCLTGTILQVIHADQRWFGDGRPTWAKAPTAADACAKAKRAAVRLGHRNYAGMTGTAALALIIGGCSSWRRCGSHACFECGRADQRWLVDAFGKLLRKPQAGYQDFSFNLVMPDGQAGVGDLESAPFDRVLGKCRLALDQCKPVEFAVFGIDISANDDTDKFKHGRLTLGPRRYWQVHIYGVVRTSDRQAAWGSLRHLFSEAENISHPLRMSTKPFDGSARGISYICKPDAFRHTVYVDKAGKLNTPRKPPALTARQHVHYLLAMHDLGFARRVALVGLHPVVTRATKKKNSGIALRRVFRGSSPCS
jgi:hypothetical protein